MTLVAKVEQQIIEEQLIRHGDIVVVAVSGGPDSAALLHILFALSEKWRWTLIVAHMDHQFRGEESRKEAEFVARWAATLGLACEVASVNMPDYIKKTGTNAQAAAREKRYEFLHRIAAKYKATSIALAHHADDQSETILMRLIQGTGPTGLSGIPLRRTEKKVELIRPLIRIYKTDILSYCQQHQIKYCMDSSNLNRKYVRNRIRLELMPLLKQYNPSFPQSLNRLAETMYEEDQYLNGLTQEKFKEIIVPLQGSYQFARNDFMVMHCALQRRLIKLILSYLSENQKNIDFDTVERIRSAILQDYPSNLRIDISDEMGFTREYDIIYIHLGKTLIQQIDYHHQISSFPRELAVNDLDTLVFRECISTDKVVEQADLLSVMQKPHEAVFDLDQVPLPLQVRNRRPGDRIQLFGLNGSKKVKDIFIDCKVPPRLRNVIPLVVDATERIIWIPGLRRSSHALVTSDTKRRLCIHMQYHNK